MCFVLCSNLGAVDPGAGGAGGTVRPRPYFIPLLQQVLGVPSSTGLPPPFLCPPPDQSQPPLQPASPLPVPSPYTEQSGGLTERREPASRPVSPVRTARRAPRLRPPPVPGTHTMALRPSSVPLHVPLPAPPESSLPEVPDPESDRARAASPTVARLLATAVTDPSFESAAASALVAELLDFAAACRLDYASALVAESVPASPPSVGGECALGTDVLEDRQEDFECLATAVPRFASLLLAPEGDPDAPDIPTPRSYAEAITGASESALLGTAPAEALHTFTLDSSASHCFFRDSTTLTPVPAPVPVRLANPSRGPVLARSSTVLRCSAGHAPLGVTQVDPLPGTVPIEVAVDSGAARGTASGSATSRGAEPASVEPGGAAPAGAEREGAESRGAEPEGAEPGGREPKVAEPGSAESEGAVSGGVEPRGTASSGGPARASPRRSPRPKPLFPQQLREWCSQRTRLRSGAARAGDYAAGGTGAGGAGTTSLGNDGVRAGGGGTGGVAAAGPGGARTKGTGAAEAGGVGGVAAGVAGAGDPGAGGARAGGTGAGGAGAGEAGAGDPGVGGAGAGGTGPGGTGAGGAEAGGAGAGDPGARGAGAGGTGAGGAGAGGTGAGGAGAGGTRAIDPGAGGGGAGGAASGGTGARGTVQRCPFFVPPPPSSLPPPDSVLRHALSLLSSSALPPSLLTRAASPTVSRLLATVVTDLSFESFATSALVAELVDYAAACRFDYATSLVAESESDCPPSVGGECALGTDVLEARQEDFECLAASVPHLVAMLLALEGDPDAPNIPTPRSYAEAIMGPYSCQWQIAMDAEMASWKSKGTYVDAVPPSWVNMVDGMWIFRGVDFFQTFSPTPKMTTLRVLLHVAAQRDYELHSLDFSTSFLQGSLHGEIWLRRPPGFTGLFPAGTQWSLRRPVYGLRQAPREWHDTLRTTLAALGFAPSTTNPSLFLRTDTSLPPLYVLVYIDDFVFATADTETLALVNSELQKRQTCNDLGELRNYLGLQITRDRARSTIT
ncbi:unnamed protein product [Closterium sp. NIES-54]